MTILKMAAASNDRDLLIKLPWGVVSKMSISLMPIVIWPRKSISMCILARLSWTEVLHLHNKIGRNKSGLLMTPNNPRVLIKLPRN